MKKLFVASAAALILGTFAAQADSYVSVLGGPTFAPALRVGGAKFDMDTGFNVGARIGTTLDRWNLPDFSVEADGLFGQSTYAGNNNARLQTSSYMGNLIYHLPVFTGTPWGVYGGGGLGAVNTNVDNGVGNHGGSTRRNGSAYSGAHGRRDAA